MFSFFSLFYDDSPSANEEEATILAYIPPLVASEINDSLLKLISLLELEHIVF